MEKNMQPQLRFSEFSGEWEKNTLGKSGEIISGLIYSPNDVVQDGILVFRSSNVHERRLKFENNVYVNVKSYNPVKENDILICVRNGSKRLIGKNALITKANEGLAFGAFMSIYRSSFNKFIFQYFDTNKYKKNVYTNLGATINSINGSDLKKFKINLPTLPEQEKIASFLSSVDTKIDNLEEKKELLGEYKKGIMQKIFSQEIRFKDNNGNPYPEWEEKKLGEVIDVRDGTHDSPKYIETGYPMITSKNLLKNGTIDYTNVNYLTLKDYDEINKRSKVHKGDILFGMIGTIGNPVTVDKEGFAIKNVALIKEVSELKNNFLIHYLNSSHISKQFYVLNAGGTQKFIALGVIRNLIINTPCLEEQEQIADFLFGIDKKIDLVEEEMKSNKEFKKGLLQQMFV